MPRNPEFTPFILFFTSSSDEENEDYDKVQNTETQPSTSSAVKTWDSDYEEESQQNTSNVFIYIVQKNLR